MIYGNSGSAHFIRAYHGCYDPLAYPLFYPRGETRWEDKKILLEDPPIVRFPRKKESILSVKNYVNAPHWVSKLDRVLITIFMCFLCYL